MFLKRKQCGKIKGRGCADGCKQRLYTAKEEASSPTVAIESVMLSCSIGAAKNSDVTTLDTPGAFMHADMDDEVYMILIGKMAELLVSLDPDKYSRSFTPRTAAISYMSNSGCTIRHPQGCFTILETSLSKTARMGICCQPVRYLRCQQNDQQCPMYHALAHQ
jgi:hypothetical protein